MIDSDYKKTSEIINKQIDLFDFESQSIDLDLINKAENSLGIIFPKTYKDFLRDYGSGGLGSLEIYGLTKNSSVDFTKGSIPDGIWATLNAREKYGLPHRFIIIGSTGDGFWYALDSSQPDENGEYPVGICGFGENNEGFEKINNTFAEYLLEQITQALEYQD